MKKILKSNIVKRVITLSLVFSFIFPVIFTSSYSYAATVSAEDYDMSNMSLKEIEEKVVIDLKREGLTDAEIEGIIERNPITRESLEGGGY